jgi:regulator of sigma E protease
MASVSVEANSPASQAGLSPGHEIVGFFGVPLATDPGTAQAVLTEALLSGSPLLVDVARNGSIDQVEIVPSLESLPQLQLGVFEAHGRVMALRDGHGTELQVGDFLLLAGDRSVRSVESVQSACVAAGQLPSLTILRDGVRMTLPPVASVTPRGFASHVQLGPDPDAIRIVVREGGPAAAAGLMDGDQILRVGNEELLSFQNLRNALAAAEGDPMQLQVLRDSQTYDLEVQAKEARTHVYGISAGMLRETVRETDLVAAIGTGLVQARTMVRQVFLSFKRIVTGAIPASNLGGIITISRTGHYFATNGLIPFLFFLCMISVHLGVLNLLPIPALDGGHLFFLLVEAIRGKPVSEKVLLLFNFSGFVLIMGLVIFVTILDIGRLVP